MKINTIATSILVLIITSTYVASHQQNRLTTISFINIHSNNKIKIGYNLESVAFEYSYWDESTSDIRKDIKNKLSGFSGIVLRYPGGSVSNKFNILDATGSKRKNQKLVDWLESKPVKFGPLEYSEFVKSLNGNTWFVLNIFEYYKSPNKRIYLKELINLLKHINDNRKIMGIELGNEVYLPKHKITGEQYANIINPIIEILKKEFPGVNIVVGLQGFDVGSKLADTFNTEVLNNLKHYDIGYSLHYYYDGPPGGPPISSAVLNIKKSITKINEYTKNKTKIWITEHGKWPGGKTTQSNWNELWPKSYDMGAALSIAEFTLDVTQIPEVEGIFLHALGGNNGPWSMFHSEDYGINNINSVTKLTQNLLHVISLGKIFGGSVNTSHIKSILITSDNSKLYIVILNKSDKNKKIKLNLPIYADEEVLFSEESVSADSTAHNTKMQNNSIVYKKNHKNKKVFTSDGNIELDLPKLSISVFSLESE
ncbi:MAG: hypothetical protein JAZ17_22025 [Candidatus Thiodiazotropha endolucinida]|nr:hypothetical protein [Candidatus Thiodiazotropha taylori]MCG8096266.1 hypothetical protein [Candidatus Thiodiazotropha endolucinida]MCW4315070.1 hypothetical protein [Candidatus Thiodiazotropha taylori]